MTPIIEAFVYASAAVAASAIIAAVAREFLTLRRKVAALELWHEGVDFRLNALELERAIARGTAGVLEPAAVRERLRPRWPIIGGN